MKTNLIGNEETVTCIICKKEYIKRKIPNIGGRRRAIRGSHTKTCSSKCSREYMRLLNNERAKKYQKKKSALLKCNVDHKKMILKVKEEYERGNNDIRYPHVAVLCKECGNTFNMDGDGTF